MSQQQQPQQLDPRPKQPQQQPQQTNWLKVTIITAIVGGIVQIIVNHFDAIVTFLAGIFSQIHLPPLQGSLFIIIINILSASFTILGAILSLLQFWARRRRR